MKFIHLFLFNNFIISVLLILFGFLFKYKTYNERLIYEVVSLKPFYTYSLQKLNKVCILFGFSLLLFTSYFTFTLYFKTRSN
jgi:hypothetical protein